jgi:mRNA-degrading endonuclease RelE of RelBE toxin-antitoxin system
MYKPEFDEGWKVHFHELPEDIKERVAKKIKKILEGLPGRHLRHGIDFFVQEVGQYRICYKSDEQKKLRVFYFVGNHKDYEKWIGIKK